MTSAAPPEVFTTERLTLRRLRLADAPIVFERWARDPEITRYLTWRPHESIAESMAHAQRCEDAWESGASWAWIIEERATGRAVGSIAAHPAGHRVALGYLLARDSQGRGFMTEAVTELTRWFLEQPRVFRVWAVCDVENLASARVLERAGFRLEGTLGRWIVHPNLGPDPRDSRCYARVRGRAPLDAPR